MSIAILCKSFCSKLHFTSRVSSCIRLGNGNIKNVQLNNQRSNLQVYHFCSGFTFPHSKSDEQTSASGGKPKHPSNAFFIYLLNVQEQIKKNHPNATRPEIVSMASKQWRTLDPEEKSRIAMQRKKQYEKYKKDLKDYLENMTPEEIKLMEKKKQQKLAKKLKMARRKLGMPRLPSSPFAFFMIEQYHQHAGDASAGEIFKRLHGVWASFSDAEKEKYQLQSAQSSQTYREEMERWEKEMMIIGRFDVLRKSTLLRLATGNNSKSKNKDEDL